MKQFRYICFLIILVMVGCASLPPQVPQNDNSSLIGISVKNKILIEPSVFFSSILLIRLADNEKSYLSDNTIIQSNFRKGDQYYFLNAEPGRYIAIAGVGNSDRGSGDTVQASGTSIFYFPKEMIAMTEILVLPGEAAYMGQFIVETPFNLKYTIANPDEAQLFYCKRLQPRFVNPTLGGCLVDSFFAIFGVFRSADAVVVKETSRLPEKEIVFWTKAMKHFEGSSLQRRQYAEHIKRNERWRNIIGMKLARLVKSV